MRFVHSLQGAAAVHVASDEVVPAKGLVSQDLIKLIGTAYNFSVKPQIPQGMLPALMLPYIFQAGWAVLEEGKVPVYQLVVLANGDIVNSSTTELADKILDDYMARLDAELGYRFATAETKRRTYQSHIVVDFDADFSMKVEALGRVERLLADTIHRPVPFKLRRIAFGSGPTIVQSTSITLEIFENSDFVIERRESDPHDEHRSYSAAPTTTTEHIRILEALESEL